MLHAAGGLLVGRTVAVLTTTTLATSLAAREGPVHMAGFQICFEVWLAISLLTDALALAGQVLDFSLYRELYNTFHKFQPKKENTPY